MRALAALTRPWRRSQRELREHLRSVFGAHNIDCVVDVGAHRGKFYRLLREDLAFTGPVVSIEPIAELAAELEKRARREAGWRIQRCALGASSGTARLNVMARSDFSSLLEPSDAATGKFHALNAVTRTEDVPMRTLDELMSEDSGKAQRLYLKLDTQGYDLEVLRGAQNTLPRVAALQSEISFLPIYAGMPSWQESIQRIGALGFAVSGIFSVSRDPSLRLVEADCVFVRT